MPSHHHQLEALARDECDRRLRAERVGRLGFVDAGQPLVLPVNYVWTGSSVLVRTGHGSKVAAAAEGQRVCFEVDGAAEDGSGWSVLVKGRAELVPEREAFDELEDLPLDPWVVDPDRRLVIRLVADEVTGRELR